MSSGGNSKDRIRTQTNEIHVHKLVQSHNCTYEAIYKKYERYIDPITRMIPVDVLKTATI